MPWKNGGGTTHEIALLSDPEDPGRPLWRLSLATIASDGPFSDFSGYDRTIVALEGHGVELAFDGGETVRLTRVQHAFSFRGERRVRGRLLDGPVRDFNVMTRRDRYRHRLSFVPLAAGERRAIKGASFALVLRGNLDVAREAARAFDTLELDPRAGADVVAGIEGASLCVVSFRIP